MNRLLVPPHVAHRAFNTRVSAGELLNQLHPAPGELLYPLVRWIGARIHLGADLLDEPGPLFFYLAYPLLPERAPPLLEVLPLFRGVVFLGPLRHLDYLRSYLDQLLG